VAYARRIGGKRSVRLSEIDPGNHGGLTEDECEEQLDALRAELRELQELVFAASCNSILVILQGMDAAGKDVTIGNVFALADPASCRVAAFKEPTPEEEAHHFLWRADRVTPALGELVIFDRSYYEQVILPQVYGDEPGEEIERRHDHIAAFERLLRDAGTIVMKFFLHVSNGEQRKRLEERQGNLDTAWKISARDWEARECWDAYMAAYDATMHATATRDAPWYVVPADQQWFHTLAVAETLVQRLRPERDRWVKERDRRGKEKRKEAEEARG
jgi:PPK2 family polyphosphate:nucleotide phosphotransferase